MPHQTKIENNACVSCATIIDESILVSLQVEEQWTLFLCEKKVKQKLLKLGCEPQKLNEAYKRFIENFAHFKICAHTEIVAQEV